MVAVSLKKKSLADAGGGVEADGDVVDGEPAREGDAVPLVEAVNDDLVAVFFFFQAEDGIRDSSVTGVQTCALPIFRNTVKSYF